MKSISVLQGLCAKLQRDKSAPMDALNSNTNVEWNDGYDNISDKVEIRIEKKNNTRQRTIKAAQRKLGNRRIIATAYLTVGGAGSSLKRSQLSQIIFQALK